MLMRDNSERVQRLFAEGAALLKGGNSVKALECFQGAIGIDSSAPLLHLYCGTALHDLGRYDEAIARYRCAINLSPDMGVAYNNLGNSLLALGCFAEAADNFSKAAELLVGSPVPLTALATVQQALGKIAEAESCCRKALLLAPDFAAAHWNLALNLLLQGKYTEGWQEYEWRWLKPAFTSPRRHPDVPLWDGSQLNGCTVVLHAEQGFGDAIQFIRYASLVAQQGGKVIIECHQQLVRLFQTVVGAAMVVPFETALPPVSFQVPLLSLPRIFSTTIQTVPAHCPYLSVPAECRNKWANMLSDPRECLRVGIVWAGKSYPDPLRSCRLTDFAPLATIPNTIFYSLQLGAGAEQVCSPPREMVLRDLTSQLEDFADTAALIAQLDLVVSIDTAVAHLAGALNKPVCLLLPQAPDWRWLLDREDSPWYPSMKIFRQEKSGDWSNVITTIKMVLSRLSGYKKTFKGNP